MFDHPSIIALVLSKESVGDHLGSVELSGGHLVIGQLIAVALSRSGAIATYRSSIIIEQHVLIAT